LASLAYSRHNFLSARLNSYFSLTSKREIISGVGAQAAVLSHHRMLKGHCCFSV
jgi:hypothetical protein